MRFLTLSPLWALREVVHQHHPPPARGSGPERLLHVLLRFEERPGCRPFHGHGRSHARESVMLCREQREVLAPVARRRARSPLASPRRAVLQRTRRETFVERSSLRTRSAALAWFPRAPPAKAPSGTRPFGQGGGRPFFEVRLQELARRLSQLGFGAGLPLLGGEGLPFACGGSVALLRLERPTPKVLATSEVGVDQVHLRSHL